MREPIQDLIGREEFVGKVCALMDGLAADNHFCLAIDGDWGSGKTFVLNMIEEKLSAHDEYFIIRYDAWENSFYDDPLIAILSCIIDSMQAELSRIEGFKNVLKAKGKEALEAYLNANPRLKSVYNAVKEIANLIKEFKNPFVKDTDQKSISGFKSYQALLDEVKKKLGLIVESKTESNKQGRLVFLVDEIDRCLPNEQLKILERIHHLLTIPNCFVVCAINGKSIGNVVNRVYGIRGREYLKKFFDFTYHLETGAKSYCKRLFDLFEEKLYAVDKEIEWREQPVKQAYQCLLYGNKHVFEETDNRSMKRYFDSLYQACNAFGWNNMNARNTFFIIIALFIRRNLSTTFLDPEEILSHPPTDGYAYDYQNSPMPYHDYLLDYIGLDRENQPYEIVQYGSRINLAGLSWSFNKIITYSLDKAVQSSYLDLEGPYNTFFPHDSQCIALRTLILRYGGDNNQSEKQDEKQRS